MMIENSEVVLSVRNLTANVDGTPILKGVNLDVRSGEIHAIMGRMVLVRVPFLRCWLGIRRMR